jgi:DNA-binding transcriptional MerR regulator
VSGLTVGQLAALAHTSVRTLHHYDDIGLLAPSGRTDAGYRVYAEADLERLQRILFYRELDFSLETIRHMLSEPDATTDSHLRRQHRLFRERIVRYQSLLEALEKEMQARHMGISLTPEEQFEVFGTDKLNEHLDEAKQRWGETSAWAESQRRTSAYSKEDWIRIKAEADANINAFAAAMRGGLPPTSEQAMDLAEAHRQHINTWFYDCGYTRDRALADYYVSEPRFTAEYDKVEPGFSQYVREAILANVARHDLAE